VNDWKGSGRKRLSQTRTEVPYLPTEMVRYICWPPEEPGYDYRQVHNVSYVMHTGCFCHRGKAAGVWSHVTSTPTSLHDGVLN
jgi:hypothetical protein